MRLDLIMQEDLEMTLQKYLKHLKMLKAELRKTKGGSLYIKHCNDRILFTEYKNGHEVGIGKDMQKVHRLARRKYAEVVYRQLENHCRELQQLIVTMQKSNRKKLPDSFIQKLGLLRRYTYSALSETEFLVDKINEILVYPKCGELTKIKNISVY